MKILSKQAQQCLYLEDLEDANETMEEYLGEHVREAFQMNDWDEPKFTECQFTYKGDDYIWSIKEDGVCEVTYDHRILYWDSTVRKV